MTKQKIDDKQIERSLEILEDNKTTINSHLNYTNREEQLAKETAIEALKICNILIEQTAQLEKENRDLKDTMNMLV